jgi:hypothetical protein
MASAAKFVMASFPGAADPNVTRAGGGGHDIDLSGWRRAADFDFSARSADVSTATGDQKARNNGQKDLEKFFHGCFENSAY